MRPKHVYIGDYLASYIHNVGYLLVSRVTLKKIKRKRESEDQGIKGKLKKF